MGKESRNPSFSGKNHCARNPARHILGRIRQSQPTPDSVDPVAAHTLSRPYGRERASLDSHWAGNDLKGIRARPLHHCLLIVIQSTAGGQR